jgi:isoprenylcysteine carboxyl methyltransferase (ICMT) family protein YpbQ
LGSRTAELPPLTGIARVVRELRYQEAARQGIGLLLMPVFALLAQPIRPLFIAGAALALIGTLVRVFASGYIVKNKQLATDGPYSLVRHPLYTGNLLLLIGFTLANGCWWAALVALWFWWFYYPPAVEYEDRKLRRIFGEPCASWQKSVPAVLPRSLLPSRGGHWSLRTSLTRNAEPLVVLYSLFWLAWIARQLGA